MKKIILLFTIILGTFSYSQNTGRADITNAKNEKLILLSQKHEANYFKNYELAKSQYDPIIIDNISQKKSFLYGLGLDGTPIYMTNHNAGAAETVNTDKLYLNGGLGLDLSGNGMTVGMWELDASRNTHQDLVGRVTQGDFSIFLSSNDNTEHATHVAGTMISSGDNDANAKGMAYEANIIGYDITNDTSEMTTEAASGLLLSNHSYGIAAFNGTTLQIPLYYFGKYLNIARDIDELIDTAEYYLPVFSAGNDRQLQGFATNKGGYDMLVGRAISKNAISVAAVEEVTNYTSPFSVNMSAFSSWGPTDDGRIKPDIAAKGVNTYSLNSTSDSAYLTQSGTSMSAPSVTGTLLLLQEHYNNLNSSYMKASTLKGLISHTANEAGFSDGPDYEYGWGLLNAEAAANCISNDNSSSKIIEKTLNNSETYQAVVTATGTEPLMATISWSDPQGDVYNASESDMLDYSTPVLVNDLDIRITNTSTTYFPWFLNPGLPQVGAQTGDNIVDNIEKIEIANPSGDYTITVSHKGTLLNNMENFSLIVTGVSSYLNTEEFSASNLLVWPNPVSDKLNFRFNSQNSSNISVSLIDIQGREVYSNVLDGNNSIINESLDTNKFAQGVYILKIKQGPAQINKRVILE